MNAEETNILFFSSFTAQRRELRKIWNGTKTDWNDFLIQHDLKAVKVADALNITLHTMSITYDLITIFKMYDNLYTVFEYHRQPTQAEIKFGEGATHYKDFNASICKKPNGDFKKWLVCPIDGLRYYK